MAAKRGRKGPHTVTGQVQVPYQRGNPNLPGATFVRR